MGPPCGINPTTQHIISERSTSELHPAPSLQLNYLVSIEKERNVLFNDTLNTFYSRLYGVGHMVKDHSATEETCCCHYTGYSFLLAARVVLYAPSHRQDRTYHDLCYITCGARNCSKQTWMTPCHTRIKMHCKSISIICFI